MGLFDYFKRRRERESAIPGAVAEPPSAGEEPEPGPVGHLVPGAASSIDVNLTAGGQPDVAQILGMVGEALRTGEFQVAHSESQVIDLGGEGAREDILVALRRHGIDPEAQEGGLQVNAGDHAGLAQEIREALERHGVDLDAGAGADRDAH